MNIRKYKRIRTALLAIIAGILAIVSLIITFSDGKNSPTWSDVSKKLGYSPYTDGASDFIRFYDVGQGDCALIYSNGKTALIDTGDTETAYDICNTLKKDGIKTIDALLITHYHTDHTGGLSDIVERFTVNNLILPEMSKTKEKIDYAKYVRQSVLAEDGEVFSAVKGMHFNVGEFEITVIGYYPELDDENDKSIFVMAEINGKKFLFTGDAGNAAEKKLLADSINFDCDVLKVGHHGSGTSTSKNFLLKATPEYAVISVGLGNQYSHPHEQALSRLETAGAKVYRTDLDGTLTFLVEGENIRIETEK